MEISFKDLNNRYNDIEGYNILNEYCPTTELQQYVVSNIEYYADVKGLCSTPAQAKNRTNLESNEYFERLVTELSDELSRRGMHQESQDTLLCLVTDMDTGKYPQRMTRPQFIRSLREPISNELMSNFGWSKSKALGLSRVMLDLLQELQ